MNAAFLLVTSACLTGADPVPTPTPMPGAPVGAPIVAAPVVSAPTSGCGGSGCGGYGGSSGCCNEGHGLFSRWRGHGSSCDSCGSSGHGGGLFSRWGSGCGSCGSSHCEQVGFFSRFRGHGSSGCNSCGSGCGNGCSFGQPVGQPGYPPGTIVQPMPGTEVKPPLKEKEEPKKLPEGKEARLPGTPELTPATNKTIEVPTKSPF